MRPKPHLHALPARDRMAPSIVWLLGTVAFGIAVVLALRAVGVVPVVAETAAPPKDAPAKASVAKAGATLKTRATSTRKVKNG